jgi:hypothetical protein
MILGAITGVPTPACLSAASNPVEAVTPPFGCWQTTMRWALKELLSVYALFRCHESGHGRHLWLEALYGR